MSLHTINFIWYLLQFPSPTCESIFAAGQGIYTTVGNWPWSSRFAITGNDNTSYNPELICWILWRNRRNQKKECATNKMQLSHVVNILPVSNFVELQNLSANTSSVTFEDRDLCRSWRSYFQYFRSRCHRVALHICLLLEGKKNIWNILHIWVRAFDSQTSLWKDLDAWWHVLVWIPDHVDNPKRVSSGRSVTRQLLWQK